MSDNTAKIPEMIRMVPIDGINVGKRRRSDLGDIDALAASIREIGLLHPIVISADGQSIDAGSSGIWPDRKTRLPARMACEYVPIAAGAASL